MKSFTLVALIAFAIVAANCARRPFDCETIVPSNMRALPFATLTPDNGRAWVAENLNVDAGEDVYKGSFTVGPGWYWKETARENKLYFHNRRSEPRLTLYSLASAPSLDDVTRCFGIPDYYRGAIGPDSLSLDLWYVSKGFTFGYSQRKPMGTFAATGSSRFDSIVIVRPGTLEQAGRRMFPQLDSAEQQAALLADVRPWPASTTEITFTTRFLEWSLGR